jgi:hypothetical protein
MSTPGSSGAHYARKVVQANGTGSQPAAADVMILSPITDRKDSMIARFVASVLLAGMATQAVAAGSVQGKVIDVRVDRGGQGMVTFDQQITGQQPGCVAAPYRNAFAFNVNTDGGKAILAVALAAKATGDTVIVYGTGACDTYGNQYVEDWSYGHIR